jgi:Family of unknown function (DUF6356)
MVDKGARMKSSDHLDAVGLGYFAHMGRALSISGRLAGGALAAFVHAFLPGLFTDAASRTVESLHREMNEPRFAPARPRLDAAEAEA